MNSTVIYIGAGDGQEVEAILDKVPDRLILIEPNPKLASKLRSKIKNFEGVEVLELAVAATSSERRRYLVEYNWNKASSIAEARQLSRAYPGLKKINSYLVECIGIEELVDKLNLNNSDENSLLIEAPGVEGEIIDLLCQAGKVSLFEQLEITCPQSSFYVSNKNEGDIVTHLEKLGFELKFRNSDDPDWQKLVLEKNKWLDELIASRKQISEQKNHIDQLKSEKEGQSKLASERQAQLEQANKTKDEQAKLAAERAVQLEQLTKERGEQSSLVSDLQTQVEELIRQKEEQSKLVSDLQAQLEQANKTKDEQANLAAERAVQLEQLTNEKEAQAKLASNLQAQLDQLTKEKEEQTKLALDRQAQLEQLTKERDEQKRIANDWEGKTKKLETSLRELELRQKLLAEELVRSEGQIDFIKDVLLPEKGI